MRACDAPAVNAERGTKDRVREQGFCSRHYIPHCTTGESALFKTFILEFLVKLP